MPFSIQWPDCRWKSHPTSSRVAFPPGPGLTLYLPMLFLNICHAWSNIALSTPELWSDIQVHCPVGENPGKLLERWFGRAVPRPLSLSLHGTAAEGMISLIDQHGHRLRNLELFVPSGIDLLEITRSRSLPSLATLTIGQGERNPPLYTGYERYADDPSECVAMLSAAPNLVECTLVNIHFDDEFEVAPSPSSLVTHSSLQRLHIGRYPRPDMLDPASSATIVCYLTLPSLQHLSISCLDTPFETFLAFLRRSSPPLTSLGLYVASLPERNLDAVAEQFLRLIPRVTNLDVMFDEEEFIFTHVLASSPRHLPNLRNLTLREGFPAFSGSRYGQVLGVLSTRLAIPHSEFRSFRSFWDDNPQIWQERELSVDVIAGMRALVAGGMDIHIGKEGHNLISVF
ncbi:hypothetical protein DFH07DRAFT_1063249 [Mycena maculata]|uniref:F-box domain-containing protein n=1 Tax=Mycena maculata TaxID=230809 RepID=A0AAD7IMC9_9AGAR|nr:hypothetical protein DFH07DRAFT_1063249 [Mycena maculata]